MKPENLALVLTWHLLQRELDTRLDARVCTFYTYGTPRNGIPMSSLIKLNCTREIWRGNLSPLERTEILQPAVILVTITPSSPPSVTVLLYLIVSLAKTDFFLNLLMCASLVSSFQTINSPPNFRSPSSPKRTTLIETRASTLPHRYSLPAIGINPLLSRPKSTRSEGEREARREEGKGGGSWNEKERRKRKRNGGKEERGGTRGFTSLSKMFYSCRVRRGPIPPSLPPFH